jgi:hypothetical protein
MWNKEQLAYLSGIIDGEGTIYVSKRLHRGLDDYWPRIQIVNTNKPMMEYIHKTFGGLLYEKNRSKHSKKWRTQYEWVTNRTLMDIILPLVIPYLICKKPQAELMIQFRNTFQKNTKYRVSQETLNLRIGFFHQMQSLNKRGI